MMGCFQLSERKRLLKKNSKLKVVPKNSLAPATISFKSSTVKSFLGHFQHVLSSKRHFEHVRVIQTTIEIEVTDKPISTSDI